jgi:hypothetical protein
VTPDALAADLERIAAGFERAATEAVDATLETGLALARSHSTGGLDEAGLRAADHPFARRHGSIRPPGRDDQINLRSGAFYGGWEKEDARVVGDAAEGSLFNVSEEARYLFDPEESKHPDGGTDLMLGRNLPAALEKELAPVLERNLEAALGRLLS